MSSLAVFPTPGPQDSITISEYNSNFVYKAENPSESQPYSYAFGQVIAQRAKLVIFFASVLQSLEGRVHTPKMPV